MSKKNISKSFTKIGQSAKEIIDNTSSKINQLNDIVSDTISSSNHFDFEKMTQNLLGNFNSLNRPNLTNAANTNLELLSKVFTTHINLFNQNFDENMKMLQNFTKCKDVKDCTHLQQDLYKQNFSCFMDMIINANSLLHSFYSGKLNSVVRNP